MRIIDRKEFLALKGQVIYSKVSNGSPEAGMFIRYESSDNYSNDWNYDPLTLVGVLDCNSSDELWDTVDKMEKDPSVSTTTDFHYTARDGCFDGDDVKFMIYERADLEGLIARLTEALEGHRDAQS